MKKTFISGRIEDAVLNGDFGTYLQNPIGSKQRTELVGQKMLLCRKKAGLSQTDVCSIIGIAPQTYSGYENGKHEPTLETLIRLSFLYGVTLDFLAAKSVNDETLLQMIEEHENVTENENLDDFKVQFQLMRQDIAELKRKINK